MNDTIVALFNFVVNLVLANHYFPNNSIQKRFSKENVIIIFLTFFLTAIYLFSNPQSYILINIIFTALLFLVIAKRNQIDMRKEFFSLIFLLLMFLICDFVSFFITKASSLSEGDDSNLLFMAGGGGIAIILKLMAVAVLKIIVLQKRKLKRPINVFLLMTLISIPMISVFVLSTAVVSEINFINHPNFIFILIAACIIYMNICILYLYITLGSYFEKLEKTTTQKIVFESELNFFKQLKHSQSKLYSMKHDLKNQYVVLMGMLSQGDTAGAEKYLQNSIQKIEHIDYFFTNNYVLNYLLNEKKSIAESNGITFNVKSFLPEKINLDTDIFAVVLGNLIDNSLNAVLRLSHSKEKEISLLIKQFDNNLLIEISNVFDTVELKTRKNRRFEGIGIKNVKRIVEENGGIYNQWVQDNQYIVSILLLNVYDKEDEE
ncbi:GHKL domain-containing protein [Paenibacillus thiaminolyticus]|uniref:sensor histidine kinase n=1 Tax=Paenibacillus thiaminolyticus TaxID=49283 RepID=UPI00232BC7A4|nr:GHKL domain-containing protein [Paenibacillus thiaminolyticus]WCF07252.1 GHKL domain-containing protein [Paenibacillus thiaminolyticus]